MSSEIYDTFYKKHRVMLDQQYGILSAGLQPRIILTHYENKLKLITYSTDHYMMGGAFLWDVHYGADYRDYPAHFPYFKKGERINVNQMYPFADDDSLFVSYQGGFFQVYERTGRIQLEMNEEMSEKYGVGLLNSDIGNIRVSKMIIKDINQNGLNDVIIGENDWSEYYPDNQRWSSKDYVPFDAEGQWRGGPLHGRMYVLLNNGESDEDPDVYDFTNYKAIENIDQYGFCTPTFADFNYNGLKDMISSSFLRDLKYFERTGDDKDGFPTFAQGVQIKQLPSVINYVITHDITKNGHSDLMISSENGCVYLLENTGKLDNADIPIFEDPIAVLQTNPPMKSDILPVSGAGELRSGHIDLVCGNGGGFFDYFYDVHKPKHSHVISSIKRILPPQSRGSIQGPSEIGWGYTCANLFDWNQNDLLDLIFSDINGEHSVSINIGTKNMPKFKKPGALVDKKSGKPLVTVWRVRPAIYKNKNGSINYYCLDEEGKLICFEKTSNFGLDNRRYILTDSGKKITFTTSYGGSRGRTKLCIVDWDKNGTPDLLLGFPRGHHFGHLYDNPEDYHKFMYASIALMENVGSADNFVLKPPQYLIHKDLGQSLVLGHHSCSPEVYEYEKHRYVIIGCEDGQFYRFNKDDFSYAKN